MNTGNTAEHDHYITQQGTQTTESANAGKRKLKARPFHCCECALLFANEIML